MIRWLFREVICKTFEHCVGLHQLPVETIPGEILHPHAFLVEFNLHVDHTKEDGYRFLHLLVYAPQRYVQVWVKESWRVWDPPPDEDCNVVTRSGASDWQLVIDHDSCWRDGIDEVLRDYERRLATFHSSAFREPHTWYQVVKPPEGLNRETRYKRGSK